jgi:micrococcal nuclease
MIRILTICLLAFAFICHPALAETLTGTCIAAYDGDTITVQVNGKKEKIRLLGIDTAEMGQGLWGVKARDFTRSLVLNKTVTVKTDVQPRDRYGRLLGYVYVDGKFLNLEIVKQGYAMTLTYPPNVAHTNEFVAAQRAAQSQGLNIWHQANGLKQSPHDFRHKGDKKTFTRGEGMKISQQPKQQAKPQATAGKVSMNTKSFKYHEPGCQYYGCKNCQEVSAADANGRGGVPGKCCH